MMFYHHLVKFAVPPIKCLGFFLTLALHGEGITNTQAERSWKVKVYHMSRILIKQSNSLATSLLDYMPNLQGILAALD